MIQGVCVAALRMIDVLCSGEVQPETSWTQVTPNLQRRSTSSWLKALPITVLWHIKPFAHNLKMISGTGCVLMTAFFENWNMSKVDALWLLKTS